MQQLFVLMVFVWTVGRLFQAVGLPLVFGEVLAGIIDGTVFSILVVMAFATTIATFGELGMIPLDKERFGRLAAALRKKIRVCHRDGESGECDYLFTAFPSGETSKEEFE